ncbi:hypothetical protein B4U79_08689 [Dinothrombium tinctorium]|uniref:Uncharacterized protein n=1 Tax=Dinothrombium tinctorium TaxID=1965070 RepID=A0A443QK55_9ACAR|nr:hypothetical protein B4U79_08689 [Dinothrombium tinctorium]
MGVKKGDVVIAYCPSDYHQAFAYLAMAAIGGVYTGCLEDSELEKVAKATNAKYLIACKENLNVASQVYRSNKNIKKLLVTDCTEVESDIVSIAKLLSEKPNFNGKEFKNALESIDNDDLLQIVFTSGTSGKVKAVPLSHRNVCADVGTTFPEFNLIAEDDTVLCYLPLFHTAGSGILCLTAFAGATIALAVDDSSKALYRFCETYKVTSAYFVPVIVADFNEMYTEENKICLKTVMSTGDSLPVNVACEFISKYKPYYFSQLYGSSEAGTITLNPEYKGTSDVKSVGIPTLEGQIKIVDIKTKSKLGANQTGEICIKTPQVFKSYLNDDLLTKERFDEDGFFRTGDAGYYDEDGNVYFVARYSSLLKYDGWFISPMELETILQTHEAVKEAAVIGTDAGILGQKPRGFVLLKDEYRDRLNENEILEYFNSHVAHYKQLRGGIVIVDSFPRTSIGKIDRKSLINY